MKRKSWVFVVLSLAAVAGCSNGPAVSSSPETDNQPSATAGAARLPTERRPQLPAKSASPADVVKAFLDAAKNGDHDVAEQLLTKAARQETEREGLTIDPPGTPSMRYEIESVEVAPENPRASYVKIRWTDSAEENGSDSAEIVWILRKESQGWRVAGMTMPQDDGAFVTWNFEESADMREIKRHVSSEPDSENIQQAARFEEVGPRK